MTKSGKRAMERWYDDACGAAHALEIVGERWSLLIVRELVFGARRFSELRAGLPGISANVLTQRLESLEEAGVLLRKQLPSPTNAQAYELTLWGIDLAPVLRALGHWAARSPTHDPELPLSAASIMMSMQTMLDGPRSARLPRTRVGFCLGTDRFVATLHEGSLQVERADPATAQVVFTCSAAMLGALLYGGLSLADAEAAGHLTLRGDRQLGKRWLTLFALPPKVAAT